MPEIPVEQVGAHSEGLDVDVPTDLVEHENPEAPVSMWHPELDALNVAPRHAFEALWKQRGWLEYDSNDPNSLDSVKAEAQDGATPDSGDSVPVDEETNAEPAGDPPAKGGTTKTGAAPAADKE